MNIEVSFKSWFCPAMLVLAISASFWAFLFGFDPQAPITWFYWGLLPGAPFALLGIHAFRAEVLKPGEYIGAAIGGLIACAPYLWLYVDTLFYSGGGANIGLGILLLGVVAYFPILMVLGAAIGRNLT